MAVARDGKLVVAGLSRRGSLAGFALARYTADGALDRSFGTGGKVLTSFGRGSYGGARSLAVRPDGKVVVAGGAAVPPRIYNGFAMARYTVAGKLDRTFGRNGKVLMYFGSRRSNVSNLAAIAIQADGKVVAVGFSSYWPIGGRTRFALARYTVRGRLDRSFGRDGKVLTDFAPRGSSSANAVAIQPDGKIVAAGGAVLSDRDYQALARYNADGTLDRSFGNRGKVVTKVGSFSEPVGVFVQPDCKASCRRKRRTRPLWRRRQARPGLGQRRQGTRRRSTRVGGRDAARSQARRGRYGHGTALPQVLARALPGGWQPR